MEFQISINSKQFDVEQNREGIKVSGKPIAYEVHNRGTSRFLIIYNLKTYDVEIISKSTKKCIVKVDHEIIELEMHSKLDQLLENMGMSGVDEDSIKEILSPMPGTIIDIMVEEGQEVSKGDPLVILEAMKMENIIKSPENRILKKIEIGIGQNVNKGDKLIIFE